MIISTPIDVGAGAAAPEVRAAAARKLAGRLVPFFLILTILSYLDRVNAGFAALQMNADLNFSPEIFGFGIGLFFYGHVLFQLPSVLLMQRVGPRRWIAILLIAWGIVSALMATIQSKEMFYGLRFLLGIAEAGFTPCMVLYISAWLPDRNRQHAIGQIMTGQTLSYIIGAPLSTGLLKAHWFHIEGWRWMFFIEGLPTILLGLAAFRILADSPKGVAWLDAAQKTWLVGALDNERPKVRSSATGARDALTDRRAWIFVSYMLLGSGAYYSGAIWLPQIVKQSMHLSNFKAGLASGLPFLVATIAMVVVARVTDRVNDRRWILLAGTGISAVGLILSGLVGNPYVAYICVCFGIIGLQSVQGPFWSAPMSWMHGDARRVGITMVSIAGGLGGGLGSWLVGYLRGHYGTFSIALIVTGGLLALAAVLITLLPLPRPLEAPEAGAL